MAEVYDEETGKWIPDGDAPAPLGTITTGDTRRIIMPNDSGNVKVGGNVMNNIRGYIEPYLPKSEPKPPTDNYVDNFRQKTAENMSFPAAMGTGIISELKGVGQGLTDPLLNSIDYAAGNPVNVEDRKKSRAHDKSYNDRVQSENPIAFGAGEIAPWMMIPQGTFSKPIAAGVKTLTGNPISKKASRLLFDSGEKILAKDGLNKWAYKGGDILKSLGVGAQKIPSAIRNNSFVDNVAMGGVASFARPDQDITEGMTTAAYGDMIFRGGGKLLSKAKSSLNKFDQGVVDWAERKRFKLMPGAKTGNKYLQQKDQALRTNQNTAGGFDAWDKHNTVQANGIMSKLIGEKTTADLGPDYMARQYTRIGSRMDELAKGTKPRLTKETYTDLEGIKQSFNDVYKEDSKVLNGYVNDIVNAIDVDGNMTGERYQEITSNLNTYVSNGLKTNAPDARFAMKIKGVLDDMVEDGMGANKLKGWKTARRQYRMLNLAQDNALDAGNVSPTKLFNYLNSKERKMFTGGAREKLDPDMKDLHSLADYGRLLQKQDGSSLGASETISRVFKNPAAAAMGSFNTMVNPYTRNIGPLDQALISLYRSGFTATPHILPTSFPRFAAKAGAANAVSGDRGEEYIQEGDQ